MPNPQSPDSIVAGPCLGRDREIAELRAQLDGALQGRGGLCQIVGEAGSGKSTLMRAFVASLNEAQAPAVIAWAQCDQQTGKIRPLAPWREILQSFSGMSDSVIPEERLRDNNRVLQSIRSTLTEFAPDIIELLIPGVGLAVKSAKLLKRTPLGERLTSSYRRPQETDVDADRSRLQQQYVAIIEQVLAKTPLIIVMDDLDCSDEASLQLLSRILGRTRDRKILILTAMRPYRTQPGIDSVLESIFQSAGPFRLDLDAIRETRGLEFVTEYVDSVIPGVGDDFVKDLCQHTGGNPLFVDELVKHLCFTGQVLRTNGAWRADPDLGWHEVPMKIENILASQLATLDAELLDILQAGSVEGNQFSIEVVAGVLERSPVWVSRALARRAPRNLVIAIGSRMLGSARVNLFRFSHSLAQRHIYSRIDPLERVYLHQAVAEHMEALAGDGTRDVAAQLAFQFEQAQVDAKAIRYYELAADLATATCSLTEAMTHLQRALDLCTRPLDEMRVKHRVAKLKLMMGSVQEGARLSAEASLIAEREGAPELSIILADQALSLMRINELDSARSVALRGEKLAREQADKFGLLSALETLAQISGKIGQPRDALDYQSQALELARRSGEDSLVAESLKKWGWCLKEVGRYDEARAALRQSLDIQTVGQPNYSQLATTYNALADLYISEENYSEARQYMLQAVAAWKRFDRNSDVAVGLSNLANLANREGLFAEALDYGRQAYDEDFKVLGGNHPELAYSLSCIGESLIGLQNYAGAIDALKKAYSLRQNHRAPRSNLAWTGWLLGRALVESGARVNEGRQYIRDARSVLAALGGAAESEVRDIDKWLERYPDQES